MCEDTVFWDLNYAMQYKEMGTAEIMIKVLKVCHKKMTNFFYHACYFQWSDEMHERLYENPNFVWLDKMSIHELLQRRTPGSCDAIVVYNNLLRWSLFYFIFRRQLFYSFPPTGLCINWIELQLVSSRTNAPDLKSQ